MLGSNIYIYINHLYICIFGGTRARPHCRCFFHFSAQLVLTCKSSSYTLVSSSRTRPLERARLRFPLSFAESEGDGAGRAKPVRTSPTGNVQ